MDVICKRWKCKSCKQIFARHNSLIKHLKEDRRTGGNTKIICSGGRFRHNLNSSEKSLYGSDTNFSCTGGDWIEEKAVEIGQHVHHKMCGHGVERRVKASI